MRPYPAEDGAVRARQPVRRWIAKLLLALLPIVLLGEVGHQVLDRLGRVLAHHLFHILFLGPSFTWRLREDGRSRSGHPGV